MKVGALCSGAGGLELAAEAVFGATTVWHCEIDPAAALVFAQHWPGVPNHGDITTADWAAAEPVDVLTAGYPCQPFSQAGRRKGTADERHLWPYVAEAVRRLRPRYVVLENVAGHRSLGFGRVLGDLASIGYDAQWCSLRAADVGACHGRERLFVLAEPKSGRPPGVVDGTTGSHWGSPGALNLLPTPEAKNSHAGPDYARMRRPGSGGHDLVTALAFFELAAGRWGKYEPAVRRWESRTRPAPSPTEPNTKGNPRLHAPFSEWMMGWPPGWATDLVGREAALRIIGNGVVPQQATAALRWLLSVSEAAA